ncbi:MAG: SDR family oxidoreductase [Bacteroidales bacterium]
MDLNLKDKSFIVCGASSGFGRAVTLNLIQEGAHVIAIARDKKKLSELERDGKGRIEIFTGDVSDEKTINRFFSEINLDKVTGALINAGGPPAMKFNETKIKDWDDAYNTLVRWKVLFSMKLIPFLKEKKYGRLVYIESASVKQPIENLVLSNSLRMAVVGMVKSLSQDLIKEGITLNILAPGYHETHAVERLVKKQSETHSISYEEAKQKITHAIPAGKMGSHMGFGSLATWLLSEKSSYVTGQTISIDGGVIQYVFG